MISDDTTTTSCIKFNGVYSYIEFNRIVPLTLRNTSKRRRHNKRKHHRRLSIHLDALAVQLDLAPADRLIWSSPGITPVKLLSRVDVHGALGPVPHEISIRNVVLYYAATEHNHPRALGAHGNGVDLANVLDNVDANLLW